MLTSLRRKLPLLPEKLGAICEKFNRSQRFYLLGFVFSVLAAFWYVTPFNDIFFTALVASGIFLTFGIVSDLLLLYKVVWETIIGRGLLLLLLAFATNLAYSVSSRLVNELVMFDTSSLTYTVNFVAFLLVPVFVFIATSVVFTLVLIVGQFYLMLTIYTEQFRNKKCIGALVRQKKENYPGVTFFARVIAFPVVLGFLIGSGKVVSPAYISFVEKTASAFIFHVDSERYSRCEVSPYERVIKVNDKEIIVVKDTQVGIKFEPKKCVPIIKP
ncbi:hypothetical protein P8S55_14665 [Halomonas sp. M1]|uniref:hypothetical protein n=1 Tax=Halomonas sp. M1 TaxID=3035470 RepID=UPI00248540C1|nr:hypothetical protein [Halomonas sp. M1]WFE71014.1 hypothetical protein P8S55_14665 [Halomonas sp. M1]